MEKMFSLHSGPGGGKQPQCWSVCVKCSWLLLRQVTIKDISFFCSFKGDHFDKSTTCHIESVQFTLWDQHWNCLYMISCYFLQIKNRWVAGVMTDISFETNSLFGLISLFSSLEVSLEIKWPLNDAGNAPSGPRGSRFMFMFFIRPWVGLSG